jgi:hypothetical protein
MTNTDSAQDKRIKQINQVHQAFSRIEALEAQLMYPVMVNRNRMVLQALREAVLCICAAPTGNHVLVANNVVAATLSHAILVSVLEGTSPALLIYADPDQINLTLSRYSAGEVNIIVTAKQLITGWNVKVPTVAHYATADDYDVCVFVDGREVVQQRYSETRSMRMRTGPVRNPEPAGA